MVQIDLQTEINKTRTTTDTLANAGPNDTDHIGWKKFLNPLP